MVIDTMVFAYVLLHVEDKYEQAIAFSFHQPLISLEPLPTLKIIKT